MLAGQICKRSDRVQKKLLNSVCLQGIVTCKDRFYEEGQHSCAKCKSLDYLNICLNHNQTICHSILCHTIHRFRFSLKAVSRNFYCHKSQNMARTKQFTNVIQYVCILHKHEVTEVYSQICCLVKCIKMYSLKLQVKS